jgi:hypothetical protein
MNDNSVISRLEGWITAWGDDDLIMMLAESNFYLNLPGSSPVRAFGWRGCDPFRREQSVGVYPCNGAGVARSSTTLR